MNRFIAAIFFLFAVSAHVHAAILLESPNGVLVAGPVNMTAACAQTYPVHITSNLSSVFSNISSTTVHTCSASIIIHSGGSIGNTTTFRSAGAVSGFDNIAFVGSGTVIFNNSVTGVNFNGTGPTTFNSGWHHDTSPAFLNSSQVISFGAASVKEVQTAWWANNPIQSAVNTGKNVFINNGTYSAVSNVALSPAQEVRGENRIGVVVNSVAGAQTFIFSPVGSYNMIAGPKIHDMTINSDYPITVNTLATFLADGTGDLPVGNAQFTNLTLMPITAMSGIGINISKTFDSDITNNDIQLFNTCILVHGSDINRIHHNRIAGFHTYGILEVSGQNFGSQNDIAYNDILNGDSTSVFIKSGSRVVSIHDNYMEQVSGSAVGFVDVTLSSIPTYGSNVSQKAYSISIMNNRIDGENLVTNVFKIDNSNSLTTVCRNRNTSGTFGNSSLLDASNYSPILNGSNFHNYYLDIDGESWGVWNGFKSSGIVGASSGGYLITGANPGGFPLYDNNSLLKNQGLLIIMPAAFTGHAHAVPNTASNTFFATGSTITVTIYARTTSASGDTLVAGLDSLQTGGSGNNFTLTKQFKKFTFTATGMAATDTYANIDLSRSTSNGDIQITSISWTN